MMQQQTPLQVVISKKRTTSRRAFVAFRHDLVATIGLFLLLAAVATAVASFYAQHALEIDPNKMSLASRLSPPSLGSGDAPLRIMGTDDLGRDIATRVMFGARVSLLVGFAAAIGSAILGVSLGLVSAYAGGKTDDFLMRIIDIQMAFPPLILALVIMTLLGSGLFNVILVLIIGQWVNQARITRGNTLSIKFSEYVMGARAIGAGPFRVMFRHILPNDLAPALVLFSFNLAQAIITEATLSFLGLGVPPTIATWGSMLSQGREYLQDAWWLSVFPGLALTFTILSIQLLGDWMRDFMDPKLRGSAKQ